jgi:hypothetical protein
MTDSTRAIITAAGESRRWKNHMGGPKHLAPVPGPHGPETLLRRQTRQLRALGVEDVVIVSPPGDARYETEGARLFPRAIDPQYHQADRFMSTELWNKEGRTLYIPGDLYATDEAIATMVNDKNRTWAWYLRLRRYEWQGHNRSRAIFGYGFWPEHHDFFRMSVKYLNALEDNKKSPVKRSLGIDLYRVMAGEPLEVFSKTKGYKYFNEHPPHSVLIDDITTDIDDQEQYNILVARLNGKTFSALHESV